MKIKTEPKSIIALHPKVFLDKGAKFKIAGGGALGECLISQTRTSKQGKKYKQFNLTVTPCHDLPYQHGNIKGKYKAGDIYIIKYLFQDRLTKIITTYGEDSFQWVGKELLVSSRKNGEGFYTWDLHPNIENITEEHNNVAIQEETPNK